MTILCVLVGVVVTTAFLAVINAGQMDWWGRMGPRHLNEKHFCWRLAVGYWGLILGGLMLKTMMSSHEGIIVVMVAGVATCIYVTNRY